MRRDATAGLDASSEPPSPIGRATSAPTETGAPGPAVEARPRLDRPRPAITLALIGGQRLLRDATASLLTAQDGLHVLGTFASATDYLAAAWERPPTVLVVDCDGGGPHEYSAAVAELGAAPTRSRVVLLCRAICAEIVRCAIEQRTSGVLLKSYSTEDILAALAYTSTGRTVLPAGWQRLLPDHAAGSVRLSPRHRQILTLIAAGRRNEEIAQDLSLSPNTIKFHIRALYSRLGVRNRVEAANLHAQIAGGDT